MFGSTVMKNIGLKFSCQFPDFGITVMLTSWNRWKLHFPPFFKDLFYLKELQKMRQKGRSSICCFATLALSTTFNEFWYCLGGGGRGNVSASGFTGFYLLGVSLIPLLFFLLLPSLYLLWIHFAVTLLNFLGPCLSSWFYTFLIHLTKYLKLCAFSKTLLQLYLTSESNVSALEQAVFFTITRKPKYLSAGWTNNCSTSIHWNTNEDKAEWSNISCYDMGGTENPTWSGRSQTQQVTYL